MTPAALAPIDGHPDKTSLVLAAIQQSIVSAQIAPGSRLSEATLAAQLNVSKTPVREALLQLRHIGLVEPTTRGLQVIMPSTKRIRDAYELRAGLEATAAGYAADRATPDERDLILQLAHESVTNAQTGDADLFRGSDHRFHLAIAEASGNERLTESVANAYVLTSVLRDRDIPPSRDSSDCDPEHVAIAQAIRAGNTELARRLASDHLLHVMAVVLDGTPPPSPPSSGLRSRN